MYISLFLSALAATTLATPITPRQTTQTGASDTWTPAANSKTTCDTTCDKFISFAQGSQLEAAVNNACAAMMPACAYQDRLPEGTFCTATIDYKLDGPKNSTQQANVVDSSATSIGDWDVQFEVTPAAQPANSPGVFWTVRDCYGYFAHMLQKSTPDGCFNGVAASIGSVKVGGDSTLAGTEFKVAVTPKTN
ncbi:hypothetical protein Ptr902_04866 [Pyrenophora tritici-repentis]|nr:hypothetical protein Ptr902_04866 [Pyrenophora tritici-repentis]